MRRYFKFGTVGFSGVIVNVGLLYILTESGIVYYISAVISIELSIINNFIWNDLWTWKDRIKKKWIIRLIEFHSVSFVAKLFNLAVLITLTEVFGIYYIFSSLCGIIVGTIINFVLNNIWTFKI